MSTGVIGPDELRIARTRSLRFEGRDHGSEISFFLVDNDPGEGPGLHRHPYTETWSVLAGEATITIDDRTVEVRAGETTVVQSHTWHRFANTGTTRLRIVCVHASPVMVTEWAPDRDRD